MKTADRFRQIPTLGSHRIQTLWIRMSVYNQGSDRIFMKSCRFPIGSDYRIESSGSSRFISYLIIAKINSRSEIRNILLCSLKLSRNQKSRHVFFPVNQKWVDCGCEWEWGCGWRYGCGWVKAGTVVKVWGWLTFCMSMRMGLWGWRFTHSHPPQHFWFISFLWLLFI